jgi:hypothetical protein
VRSAPGATLTTLTMFTTGNPVAVRLGTRLLTEARSHPS